MINDDKNPHGIPDEQIVQMDKKWGRKLFEAFASYPAATSSKQEGIRQIDEMLSRDGFVREAQAMLPNSSITQGDHSFSAMRPYTPEFDTQARAQYPRLRTTANHYWRMFHKMDGTFGAGVDLYADQAFGAFQLSGEGVDGEIRATFEQSISKSQLVAKLPMIGRSYLVDGEAVIHNMFGRNEGYWTKISLIDPNFIDVLRAPAFDLDPILMYSPDPAFKDFLKRQHPGVAEYRALLPPELLGAIESGQKLTLSPSNTTFLARKLLDWDVRGTSICSRLWQVFMLEDAVMEATLATARRSAGPIRVAKLGAPDQQWIPPPEEVARVKMMLAQAELDPLTWFVYHYGINFELVGANERVMMIDRYYDIIERMKLVALGLSKGFLHGEVTYASANSGLSVFLRRLHNFRALVEHQYIIEKFLKPIARFNKFVKPTPAEISHGVRTRRSPDDIERRLIVPGLEWEVSLDPNVDAAKINALQALDEMGVKFSKTTLAALVGRSWEGELAQKIRDARREQLLLSSNPDVATKIMSPTEGGGGGGGFGGGSGSGNMPGLDFGSDIPPPDMPPPDGAEPAPGGAEPAPGGAAGPGRGVVPGFNSPRRWTADVIDDLRSILQGKTKTPTTRLGEDFIYDVDQPNPTTLLRWLDGRGITSRDAEALVSQVIPDFDQLPL